MQDHWLAPVAAVHVSAAKDGDVILCEANAKNLEKSETFRLSRGAHGKIRIEIGDWSAFLGTLAICWGYFTIPSEWIFLCVSCGFTEYCCHSFSVGFCNKLHFLFFSFVHMTAWGEKHAVHSVELICFMRIPAPACLWVILLHIYCIINYYSSSFLSTLIQEILQCYFPVLRKWSGYSIQQSTSNRLCNSVFQWLLLKLFKNTFTSSFLALQKIGYVVIVGSLEFKEEHLTPYSLNVLFFSPFGPAISLCQWIQGNCHSMLSFLFVCHFFL